MKALKLLALTFTISFVCSGRRNLVSSDFKDKTALQIKFHSEESLSANLSRPKPKSEPISVQVFRGGPENPQNYRLKRRPTIMFFDSVEDFKEHFGKIWVLSN